MERGEKPKGPKLSDRPAFCESCPLYRSKSEGCRLLRSLYVKNPTLFTKRVQEWNQKALNQPQSVLSECSQL